MTVYTHARVGLWNFSLSNMKNIFLSENSEFSETIKKHYQQECKICSACSLITMEQIQSLSCLYKRKKILQTFIC